MINQEEIHRMAQSEDIRERLEAVNQIRNYFAVFYDKIEAWDDIIQLTLDRNDFVRWRAAHSLPSIFPYVLDKKQAWGDLLRLTQETRVDLRLYALEVLGAIFPYIPDKKSAWDSLIRLAHDKDIGMLLTVIDAMGISIYDHPVENMDMEEIYRLKEARNVEPIWNAVKALNSAVIHLSDKRQAQEDIHRLTRDKNSMVREIAAVALGAVFPNIPDKEKAWKDLNLLAYDPEISVRMSANYSLGRASIFDATNAESEENFKKELENAIELFDKSSKESDHINDPARFCLPFYQSFYAIIFKEQDVEIEIQKYLIQAKKAVEFSESREKLLEAVEYLANALKEAKKARDFAIIKSDLNVYRRYCERVADFLSTTEESAPIATKLIKKGLPIIDQKIKEIITEIQENAKTLCRQTKDTPLEDLGKEVIRVSQTFPQIRDPIGLEKGFSNLQTALSSICAKMPEEERGEACELLKKAGDEPYIEDKLPLINMVLSKISSQISAAKNIETVEKKLDDIMVSLKPGIRQELVITVGAEFAGTGAQHVITIPLQEISYPDLKKDLEKVKGKGILKLASLPAKLAEKVKDYLVRNKKYELQKT